MKPSAQDKLAKSLLRIDLPDFAQLRRRRARDIADRAGAFGLLRRRRLLYSTVMGSGVRGPLQEVATDLPGGA